MKLIDAINKIDKSAENECFVSLSAFDDEFNAYFGYVEQDRLKAYSLYSWYCTDTEVGCMVYFLDDEPVCLHIQKARKDRGYFEWFSKDKAKKVRDYLYSLENDEDFYICDMNKDIGDSYKINFSSRARGKKTAILDGREVKIVKTYSEDYEDEFCDITIEDNGVEKVVNVRDLDFKYNILD